MVLIAGLEISESILLFIVQPLLLFILAVVLWSIQSFLVLNFARKKIFPNFYKNSITSYLIAQIAIIFHEASHFLSAVFTGSTIDIKKSFVSMRRGRVAAIHEESIIGWFSRVIAASAPSFLPPILFLIIFFIAVQQIPAIPTIFEYPNTFDSLSQLFSENTTKVLVPNIGLLITKLTDLSNPITYILIYVLIVCSIAAGPSEGDWRSTLELFLSPVPAIALIAAFFILNFLFAQFQIGFFIPISILLILISVAVIIGIILSFLLSSLLGFLYKSGPAKTIAVVIAFFFVYFFLYTMVLLDLPYIFVASTCLAAVFAKILKR